MKKIMDKSTKIHKLLTGIVICTQVIGLAGTATVGLMQPTPQMAHEAAEQAGLSGWFGDALTKLTQTLQPLWGEAATADASALVDVGPQANGQFLTTVHPEENLVVNGSFEMGPDALNQTNLPGWTVTSGKVDLWNGYFNPDGSTSEIDLAGTPGPGTIEQTINGLVAGQSYFFEFSYSANTFANEQAKVQVLDGVTPLIDQTVTALGNPNSKGWQAFRQTFTAPASGIVTLHFQDLSTDPYTHYGVIIDDVRVSRRLINYALNGSFDDGPQGLNQTEIPNWTVESGKVDVWNGYYNADQSTNELDLAGTPGPGIINQNVSGLTSGQSYVFEFDYSVNAFGGEQARAQVMDGATPLINQTVTGPAGDPNNKGWKHFRQTFTSPSSGIVTLRFQDLSIDGFTYHGVVLDNVRVADAPLNFVVNGDFEASPAALNIASDAIPGWTVTSGPVDVFNPGLLYNKMVDLNGSPGDGKIEQTVSGLTGGQVYAFQFNYQNHTSLTTYAYARLLDSTNVKLYEKRVSCKGHVVNEGWCTLRYFFTAPANGIVKIVFQNDETDGNTSLGVNIDNVLISRNLDFLVNGNFSSGPTGLNQNNVPGWAVAGPTDTHDNFGGEYRFTVDLNGSPGDGKLRQVVKGLSPGQTYRLRYNYASTAHNYLVNFDIKVTDVGGTTTLLTASQSTDQLPYVGGWRQAEHTFTAPADGTVQVYFLNNETDNNLYYGPLLDNVQVWGQAAIAGTEINVCNGTVVLPKPLISAGPGGVVSGLEHWVRADKDVFSDAGTTAAVEGGSVQQWADQSANGLDLTQTTVGQKPTFREGVARGNFNPSLDFNDDFIRNTNRVVQVTDDLTFIAVGDTNVTGGVRTLYGMGDNYNDPTMDLDGTWISPWFDGGGSVDLFTSEVLTTNRPMIWGMRGTNGDTNNMHFNYSGEDVQMNMTVANQANYGQNVGLGSDGGGEDWLGRIPEAMTFSRNLSQSEMERVYSYLAVKYGITLRLETTAASTASGNYVASDSTLIWNYTGNSNFHFDVAGIGRDDASDLEQKQSNSVNADNLVTIGLGNIADDNANNTSNFQADKTFLMWGNDNASTTIATSVSVSLTRMARIWTVQETLPVSGTLGLVTVRVPQSAFGLAAGQAAFILRSTDGVFTNADTVMFMICDGTNCEAQIDFTDGDYFSFARASVAPEIDVTPTSINFGNVAVGENATRMVTVTNNGTAPLNLTSIQMTNTGGGQFSNSNSCGAILNPGQSCTLGATFTPNANGAQSGVLTFLNNDSNEGTTTVNLSGTGVVQAPRITVQPTTLTFSSTVVSNTAPAQSVFITNTGTGNLAVQNLQLSGADTDQFVIVEPSSTCSPLTKNLSDTQSCAVEVVFNPTSIGAKTATLTIFSNDITAITKTVTLNGVGSMCSGLLNIVGLNSDTLETMRADNSAAACVALITPVDVAIGKSVSPSSTTVGSTITYTLRITNTTNAIATGVVVTDAIPSGLTSLSASNSFGVSDPTLTAGSTATWTLGSIAANGTGSITITANAPATAGTITNTAGITTTGDVTATNNFASAALVVTLGAVPDLTTAIGQPSPTFVSGSPSNIPVTVTNSGTGPTTEPVTTTLTLPPGMSVPASFSNNGWSCTTVGQTVTCSTASVIANAGSSTFTVPATPSVSTIGTTPAFTATTAATAGEANTANNGPTSMTPATAVTAGPTPDLTSSVGQPSPALVANAASAVPVTVTNAGTGPTTGPVTSTVTLPPGVTAPVGFSNNGWSCATAGQTVTCTNPGPIAASGISTFTVPATPDNTTVGATPAFTNTLAATAGETNTANNGPTSMTPTTPVAAAPALDLTSVIGQPAPAFVAGTASNVPMTVTNVGTLPTTGPVTTTMTLPAGTSAPASFTSGTWNCTTAGQIVTCVSSTPIPASGSSAIQVPVTANASTVGTTPGPFSGTVLPTAGETNTANNNPTNMTPSVAVVAAPIPPVAPTINNPTSGSAVTATQPTFSGIGTPGALITITESPTGTVICTATASAGSLWSCAPAAPMSVGSHTVSAVAGNANGVSPASTPVTVTVDTTPPAVPVLTTPAASSTINDNTPLFSGTAEPGSTVVVKDGASTVCTAVADNAGNWGCSPAAVMTDGPHSVTATATDPAGNVGSPTAARTFTVATTPDLQTSIASPQPALQATLPSTLPVTISNIGVAPTNGPITTTVALPAGMTAPATFTSGPWTCTAVQPPDAFTASSATCVSSTPIPVSGSSTINVPVTPNPVLVGFNPTFNATSTGGGEANTSNNAANPLLSTAVLPASRILPIKAFLYAPYNASSGIMSDGLRLRNLIPLAEPYTGLGFARAGGSGETTTASVLAVPGSSAVIDWVLVELRDAANPATLIKTRAALLLRNGAVKDVDGTSDLSFTSLTQGNYFVALRHRNHLGVMTASPIVLTANTPIQDFTTMPAAQVNGSNARRVIGSVFALWSGNANGDAKIQAAGASNDLSAIVSLILNPNYGNNNLVRNWKVSGYYTTDVNMDGDTIASGANNDVAVVVNSVNSNPINQPALNRNTTVDQRLP